MKTYVLPWLSTSVAITLALSSARAEAVLDTVWKASLPVRALKSWSYAEIQGLKTESSRELDPASGRVTLWRGPLMSLVLEKTIESLPGDQKAQVDLIVFKTSRGEQVRLPRWVVTKYPVLLVPSKDSFRLVMPWTSKPKLKGEGLPLNRYQLSSITGVEFASYQQEFGSLYLKRRTDPLALRGEKLMVQNCTTCHKADIGRDAAKVIAGGHPQTQDAPKLESRDLRALNFYLDEFRSENAGSTAKN